MFKPILSTALVVQLAPLLLLTVLIYAFTFIVRWCDATRLEKWAYGCYRFLSAMLWPVALISAGGFQLRQGIVLGLMLAYLAYQLGSAIAAPTELFTPYSVWIKPNWYQLLTDFKLIGSFEEWESIQQSLKSSQNHSVLRVGLRFTVLRQLGSFERELIYHGNDHSFFSQIDFSEDMTPIQFETGLTDWQAPAELFIRASTETDGYDLGINVLKDWWGGVKNSCPTPIHEDGYNMTGDVKLTLATIPYREFDLYLVPVRASTRYYHKTLPKIRERIEHERRKLGWTEEKHSADFPRYGLPTILRHKYFEIWHRPI